jgi:hypothetical protein
VRRDSEFQLERHRRPFPVKRVALLEFLLDYTRLLNGSTKSLPLVMSSLKVYGHFNRHDWCERNLYLVNQVVGELQLRDPFPVKQVRPLTLNIVDKMVSTMNLADPLEHLVAMTMTLCHNSLMRSGELLNDLRVKDIEWDRAARCLTVRIYRSKAHRRGDYQRVRVVDYPGRSAYKLVKKWFDHWDLWNSPESQLIPRVVRGELDFTLTATNGWWRKAISHYLAQVELDPALYSGHSFRAGGATDLFAAHVPYPIIKKMGRWKSDAAMKYFRDEVEVGDAVAQAFGRRLVERGNWDRVWG